MKQRILDIIDQFETIIIHRHVRPDPDALGSQAGLAEMLRVSFPGKRVYIVGEEDESLTFLTRMDHISDDTYEGALVIVCDTANEERISDDRYKNGRQLIKIDHHPNEDPYCDIVWVDTAASSVSEMIYDLYEFGADRGLTLPDEAARLLYAGIVGDTGRFLFNNTTEKTFRIAANLRARDFAIDDLYEQLYKMRLNVTRLNGFVLQSFSVSSSGAGHIKLDADILERYKVTPSEASLLVNAFSDVEGMKAWVFFIEEPDQIRVRLRSKGPVVNELAKKYDGGGHPFAAGASIHSWKTADQVLHDLEEICRRFAGK